MSHLNVLPLLDEGLGNQAYLVDLGEGRALALDPHPRPGRSTRRGARSSVVFAAEARTARGLPVRRNRLAGRRAPGDQPADGGRRFDHLGLADGDEVDWGPDPAWMGHPGHTDEHMAYLLTDGDRAAAVFTGGSLIVGAAARTDLMGAEHTDDLARAQFRSLRRLSQLPDDTLCSRPTVPARSAPPLPARTAPRPSGAKRPPTR